MNRTQRSASYRRPECPPEDALVEYLAGGGSAEERESLRLHVEACDACRSWFESARNDEALLADVRRAIAGLPSAPPSVQAGVEATPLAADSMASSLATEPAMARYRITRRLGEGGMGIVFEAEQRNPQRAVALKVLKSHVVSPSMLRRFEFEAQALAKLEHPSIARIFEADTIDIGGGPQPFYAMELVRGLPLTRHAQEAGLSACERLALLAQVCDAVHHAHQKGVIHRDLNPNNILVNESGHPKVLDFGIARPTAAGTADTALRTEAGQILGTLPYMSPEQVSGDPAEIDTRTDVYALGVILFELLSGELPHELASRSIPDAVRAIAELPPKRLGAVVPRLRGDVETIAAKALEKEKGRRYASAAALADDVRRFLANEPIAARPLHTAYLLGKFARRHRALVGGVLAVIIALAGGGIAATHQMFRARRAESEVTKRLDEVELEARKYHQANRFLEDVLTQANPYESDEREPTIREALDTAARRAEAGLGAEPEVAASIRHTLGMAYAALGREAEALGHLEASRELHERAGRVREKSYAEVLRGLAWVARLQGRLDDAAGLAQKSLDISRLASPVEDASVASSLEQLGTAQGALGRLEDAEASLRQAHDLFASSTGAASAQLAGAKSSLAAVLKSRGDVHTAESLQREALAIQRRALGEQHPSQAATLDDLVELLRLRGAFEEAEGFAREALAIRGERLGEDHPRYARGLAALAYILHARRENDEAEALLRRALDITKSKLGDNHWSSVPISDALGSVLWALGKRSESEAVARQVLAARAAQLGDSHPDTVRSLRNLTRMLMDTGRAAEAERLLRERLDLLRPIWKRDDRFLAELLHTHASALCALGRFREAEPELLESFGVLKEKLTVEHPSTQLVLRTMVQLYTVLKQPVEVERHSAELRELWGRPKAKAADPATSN